MKCKKASYPSRHIAVRVRERLNKKCNRLLNVYQCLDCKKWHLGNTQETRLENINRIFDKLPQSDRIGNIK